MPTRLIKMKNFYLQKEFPESTKKHLASVFDFSDEEKLICAAWTSPVLRYGFVISNTAIYWNFKTENGIKIGEIQKSKAQNAEFEISPYILSLNSSSGRANSIAEECSRLKISANGRSKEFYISGLTEEKGKTLCDILRFGFVQGETPQIDLGKLAKEKSFVSVQSLFDNVLNFADKISEKIDKFNDYLTKGFHEITHIKIKIKRSQTSEKAETKENPENDFKLEKEEKTGAPEAESVTKDETPEKVYKKQNSPAQHGFAFSLFLNLLDACASLAFIASIIIFPKSELLRKIDLSVEQFSKIALTIFTVLKCAVAFYSKNTARKIISILLVVISILANLLISYSLQMEKSGSGIFIGVSVALCILSYFAFEFSCGFRTETIFKKIIAIIILGFALYVMAHFAIYENQKCLIRSAQYFWYQLAEFCKTL